MWKEFALLLGHIIGEELSLFPLSTAAGGSNLVARYLSFNEAFLMGGTHFPAVPSGLVLDLKHLLSLVDGERPSKG